MASAEIRALLREVRKQRGRDGRPLFRVELRKSGHYRVTGPDGRWATVPGTPRGGKAVRHRTRAVLRKIGVVL
ncbi:hypothetical protein [Streptomyces mirabilis]|uniref:hypothetical protein n=1 Tax=Streptomyces mirabilis TaxID=68239 RepID=UPI0036C59D7A